MTKIQIAAENSIPYIRIRKGEPLEFGRGLWEGLYEVDLSLFRIPGELTFIDDKYPQRIFSINTRDLPHVFQDTLNTLHKLIELPAVAASGQRETLFTHRGSKYLEERRQT